MDVNKLRAIYKAGTASALAIVALCIATFPSVVGVIGKPYVYTGWLWIFFAGLPVAIGLLIYSYYKVAFTATKLPIVATGLGNLAAIISIVALGVFLFGNLISDQTSNPRITSLMASDYTASPGEVISFTAEAQDDDGDNLIWNWSARPHAPTAQTRSSDRLPTSLKSSYWRVPEDAPYGLYRIEVTVQDDRRSSPPQFLDINIISDDEGTTAPCTS